MGKKHLIFVRGPECAERSDFARALMQKFNPDVSHITAISFSLGDFPESEKKSADRTIKNRTRRILNNSQERFVLINNENARPSHWQPFVDMAGEIKVLGEVVGIDITPGSNLTRFPKIILNLFSRNSTAFKSSCTKYYEIHLEAIHPDQYGMLPDVIEEAAKTISEELLALEE